jgi:hypothetical protein
MAQKKRPARMANRSASAVETVVKDDGGKYAVVNAAGRPVYPGGGVALSEAVRLATSLVTGAGLARVEPDGTLTPGRLDTETGTFQTAA